MAAPTAFPRRRHPDLIQISDAGEEGAEENLRVDSDSDFDGPLAPPSSDFDGPLAPPSSPRIMLSPRSPALPLRRRGTLKKAKNPPINGLSTMKSSDSDVNPQIRAPTVASICSKFEQPPPTHNVSRAIKAIDKRRSVLMAQPFAQGRINSALKKNKEGASLLESLSSPSAQRNGDHACLPASPSKSKGKDKRRSVLEARPPAQQRLKSALQKDKEGAKKSHLQMIESPSAQRSGWQSPSAQRREGMGRGRDGERDGASPDTRPQDAPIMPESDESVKDQPTNQRTSKPKPAFRASRLKIKSD